MDIHQHIDELVAETQKKSAHLGQIQQPTQKESGADWVQRAGESRGRPLFYPYVGTGNGYGCYVELTDGSVKLDLINGIGVHILGHSHPKLQKASLTAALSDVVVQGNLQPNKEYTLLLEKITEIASRNSKLKHAWLTTSGSMSGEIALKIARQKTNGARHIIAMDNAFAGRSTMMAEITDNLAFKQGQPDYNEVLRVPFYDSADPESSKKSLEIFKSHLEKHKGDISCFTFEPMQGEGGYNVAPREFFVPMLELCKSSGIPVWFDEVQTFCRTGHFFAFETLCLSEYVDICTVAKSLQTAATIYTPELNPKPGLVSGTFAGSSVALASALTVLNELDQNDYMGAEGKINQIHKKFIAMLNRLNTTSCKGLLRDAAGLGLMVAVIPLDGTKPTMIALAKKLFENGLMCFGCGRGPFKLRFLLPAVLTDEDIERAGTILEKTILEMKNA